MGKFQHSRIFAAFLFRRCSDSTIMYSFTSYPGERQANFPRKACHAPCVVMRYIAIIRGEACLTCTVSCESSNLRSVESSSGLRSYIDTIYLKNHMLYN